MDVVIPREIVMAGQYRAARAMLGWGLVEAGRRAATSPMSVLALEREMSTASETSRKAVARAYEAAGIAFHGSRAAGYGLTLKPPPDGPSSSIR